MRNTVKHVMGLLRLLRLQTGFSIVKDFYSINRERDSVFDGIFTGNVIILTNNCFRIFMWIVSITNFKCNKSFRERHLDFEVLFSYQKELFDILRHFNYKIS